VRLEARKGIQTEDTGLQPSVASRPKRASLILDVFQGVTFSRLRFKL